MLRVLPAVIWVLLGSAFALGGLSHPCKSPAGAAALAASRAIGHSSGGFASVCREETEDAGANGLRGGQSQNTLPIYAATRFTDCIVVTAPNRAGPR
ncbi:MAG: hypothetical protein KF733_04760 [Fimbriimonadaceae bacterium]|nr:MAG: hypothetical protein KF733_04760 [Fimbriimonadaceae bacterium]